MAIEALAFLTVVSASAAFRYLASPVKRRAFKMALHAKIGYKAARYSDFIVDASIAYGTDPFVIAGLIHRESGWNATIMGDGGDAFGLGQINRRFQKWFFLSGDPLNPVKNIFGIAKILRDDRKTLEPFKPPFPEQTYIAAYNTGATGKGSALEAARQGDPDLYTTGKNYSHDVLTTADALLAKYQAILDTGILEA